MLEESVLDKLKNYRIYSKKEYFDEAFSRNIGLFTPQEQKKLAGAKGKEKRGPCYYGWPFRV